MIKREAVQLKVWVAIGNRQPARQTGRKIFLEQNFANLEKIRDPPITVAFGEMWFENVKFGKENLADGPGRDLKRINRNSATSNLGQIACHCRRSDKH